MFFEKKLAKNLEGTEKVCTFASAFAQKSGKWAQSQDFLSFAERSRFSTWKVKIWALAQKEGVLWKIYIDRSSTRSECLYIIK